MPRTAPVIDGTPLYKDVSLRWIDVSGDKEADNYTFPPTVTAAEIEAFADAMGDASNANLYEVIVKDVYADLPNVDDAVEATKESIFDVAVLGAKTPTKLYQNLFVRAPIDALLVDVGAGSTDIIAAGAAELVAAMDAWLVLLNKAAAGYEVISGRYTERTEINQKISM